jgi:hypothetical protein
MPGPDKTLTGPFLLDRRTWTLLAPIVALAALVAVW